MKYFALLSISLVAAVSARANFLSLEAHEIGTGDARISNWETNYGSYDRDFSRSKKILVTLHNLSRKPSPFAVTVYFIAKPTVAPGSTGSDPRTLFIYDRHEHADEFHNEIELKGSFSSRELGANITHYQALGVESAAGADMIGWIVVGYSDGQRFGEAASSQELLQLARGRPQGSLEAMIADYEKDHLSTLTGTSAKLSEPAPPPVAAPQGPRAAPAAQEQVAEFVTLTKPVEVKIAYGKTKLPLGTRLKVVSRTATMMNASYLGDTIAVPADAVAAK